MVDRFDRRNLIRRGAQGGAVAAGAAALVAPFAFAGGHQSAVTVPPHHAMQTDDDHGGHNMSLTVGEVDIQRLGWDPADVLTEFDYGR